MATIIPFPQKVKKTRDELNAELDDMIIDVSLDLSLGLFSRLQSILPMGDDDPILDPSMQKSMILIHEAIKGAVARAYQREHFLHEFSDDVIQFEGSDIRFEIYDEE